MTPDRAIPRATYRLQLHRGFTFRDATDLVAYLARLGISHLYCSPFLRARSGSSHGYDIVDHGELNPEIGSRAEFDRLVQALAAQGMGLMMDVVPNHMGVLGADNAWWLDVLENGRSSRYAGFFDIDWEPPNAHLRNKVLVPVLGAHYATCLQQRQLAPEFDVDAGTFGIRYFQHFFPLGPRSYADILARAADELAAQGDPWAKRLAALGGAFGSLPHRDDAAPEKVALRQTGQLLCKQQLADLCREHPAAATAIEQSLADLGADEEALHALLEQQAYRLAFWRVAADEINYRRFFDINDLAALRMEDEAVFEATHALVFELVAAGAVQALRIDHPDGLLDPAGYFRRLQEAYRRNRPDDPEGRLYVAVEKIIAPFESLPADWEVDGSTGYRFANVVNGLFVDGAAEKRFTRTYQAFIGEGAPFDEIAQRAKRLVLGSALASELTVLAGRLSRIAQADRHTRDYSLNTLRQALIDVIAAFPVYRTYVVDAASAEDTRYVDWAVAKAKRRSLAADPGIFDFLRGVLVGGRDRPSDADFTRRFQQLTAPVMAKGVEDTAFYLYNRLASLNDVGSDPSEFGIGVHAFHGATADRAARWPQTMLATSTHDNKRSEDVRTRIDVLSESPAAWRKRLSRWARLNRGKKGEADGEPAPSRNDEYLLYQTLVGSFPVDAQGAALEAYRDRVCTFAVKAAREAKQRSSWVNPSASYEAALQAFVHGLLAESGRNLFLADLRLACADIAWFGALNSLSLVLVKLTSPGIPDIYQGNEMIDLSLVDPDNRRPVDWALRRERLEALATMDAATAAGLPADPTDGRAKLFLTWRLLQLRRERPALFREAGYAPLQASGNFAEHVVAYARPHRDGGVVAIAGRLFAGLAQARALPCGDAWGDTRVALPFIGEGTPLTDVLTGRRHRIERGGLSMAQAWADWPGAVLAYGEGENPAG